MDVRTVRTSNTLNMRVLKAEKVFKMATFDEWITGTTIHNYILKDHLSDWIKLYGPQVSSNGEMLEFLFSQGNKFEEKLVKEINKIIPVVFISSRFSSVGRTIQQMEKGVPIIHSASLASEQLKLKGLADLIIRSDYINQLVPGTIPLWMEKQGCRMHQNFHYLIIDIKFSTLPLRADGEHILNSGRYKAYKSQVWLYTQIIGEIQGYTPSIAFIMGRGYTSGNNQRGNSAFLKLGKVDFEDVDENIPGESRDAIEWVRRLRKEGGVWTYLDHPELYPNMNVFSPQSYNQKRELANHIGEITQMWSCGVEQRELALSHGVSSWKDPRFTAELVGFRNHQALILNQILRVNRDCSLEYLPEKLSDTGKSLCRKINREFFVDFETFSGVFDDFSRLPESNPVNMIFMISVVKIGTERDEVEGTVGAAETDGEERTFCVNSLNLEEELRIMKEFLKYVGEESELYHWSDAEPLQWNAALQRHPSLTSTAPSATLSDRWTDLMMIFKNEPIAIQGCFSFSLKDISKALSALNLIPDSPWTSNVINGEEAMLYAYREFSKGNTIETSLILQDIALYNREDCWAVYYALEFIRVYL